MNNLQRTVTIVLPQAVVDAMKAQAQAQRRSCTGEIIWALQAYVAQQQQPEQR
jgi:hypothetical protein